VEFEKFGVSSQISQLRIIGFMYYFSMDRLCTFNFSRSQYRSAQTDKCEFIHRIDMKFIYW